MFRKLVQVLIIAAILAAPLAFVPSAASASAACDVRVNNTHKKLLECVTLEGVRQHQAALQAIADANNGIRTSGTPGYDASVDYAAGVFSAAGYNVTIQPFQFQTFISLSPSILETAIAHPRTGCQQHPVLLGQRGCHRPGQRSRGRASSAATPPTGPVSRLGNIALVSRGTCTFAIKATNAAAAGASGVVIYNNTAGVLNGTLGNTFTLNIPVTSVTQADGLMLAALVPSGSSCA